MMSESAAVVGAPVVAVYIEDMNYYRAIIISSPDNSRKVKVHWYSINFLAYIILLITYSVVV